MFSYVYGIGVVINLVAVDGWACVADADTGTVFVDIASRYRSTGKRDKINPGTVAVKLAGFNFGLVKSAMGGSFGARWSVFSKHADDFLSKVNIKNQFDTDFWAFIKQNYYKRPYYIYMLSDFSLYQHTNMVSQYGHHWPHTYGDCYDPIVNPFGVPV